MAKYKLTVKYSGVCELSIAGDIPDIIQSEFDQYVKSILYKKEEWENFETNFKQAARLEYGDPKKLKERSAIQDEKIEEIQEEAETIAAKEETAKEEIQKDTKEETPAPAIEPEPVNAVEEKSTFVKDAIQINEVEENSKKEAEQPVKENKADKNEEKQAQSTPKAEEKPKKRREIISFGEYVKDKNISTPLDEFVAGACYLDEVLNVKEFSLKQINAKLYPVYKRLASSIVIKEAIERVLIETIKDKDKVRYTINQNAWNYHNYDLVRH